MQTNSTRAIAAVAERLNTPNANTGTARAIGAMWPRLIADLRKAHPESAPSAPCDADLEDAAATAVLELLTGAHTRWTFSGVLRRATWRLRDIQRRAKRLQSADPSPDKDAEEYRGDTFLSERDCPWHAETVDGSIRRGSSYWQWQDTAACLPPPDFVDPIRAVRATRRKLVAARLSAVRQAAAKRDAP